MSEYKQIIKEFLCQYEGEQYQCQIKKGIREDHVVVVVTDTVTGNVIMKEISTRQWEEVK